MSFEMEVFKNLQFPKSYLAYRIRLVGISESLHLMIIKVYAPAELATPSGKVELAHLSMMWCVCLGSEPMCTFKHGSAGVVW
jgi:hypothetical protein